MTDDERSDDEMKVFVSDRSGPDDYACFFEDDGETGYLYVSDRRRKEIVRHLQIYTNSLHLNVGQQDVDVLWSADGTKCGVRIWGGMRGIIDLKNGIEARAFVEDRHTPPITDSKWLSGF